MSDLLIMDSFLSFFLIYSKVNFLDYFISNREFISFLIIISGFYVVGLYDDKYKLSPLSRIILMSFILYVSMTLNHSFQISKIDFSFINKRIYLNDLSIFSSIICVLICISLIIIVHNKWTDF